MQPALMQATSRESLLRLRGRLDEVVEPLTEAEATELAADVFSVAGLLSRESGLRRTLGDSSTDDDARAGLVSQLLEGKVGTTSVELVSEVVRAQWSGPGDLVDALVDLGRQVGFAAAEKDGTIDGVEDDIFRFGRILEANGELDQSLSDVSATADRKVALLDELLDGKVSPLALTLLTQTIVTARGQSAYDSARDLSEQAARRRQRSVAVVKSPVALTLQQEERLTGSLSRIYGRDISVSVDVDPGILGGLRVQVGDEVIDGSVAHRLDEVRRRFAR